MTERNARFTATTLPYLNAAYNLARWLVRDDNGAQDVVQESYLRALRYFDSFKGGDPKPWLLGIVRNYSYTWLKNQRQADAHFEFDEERDGGAEMPMSSALDGPEQSLLRKQDLERIDQAIEELPIQFREVIVLRELEDLPYAAIAEALEIPIGTVMSRLGRARAMLRVKLASPTKRAAE